MRRAGRVTAMDVARAAGVSQTTVSFVVNATPGQSISEGTRRRVLDAVRDLGYTPNSTAVALRRGHSDQVLLPLPDLPLAPAVARLVDALSVGLAEHGLSLQIRRPRPGHSIGALCREASPAAVISVGEPAADDLAEMDAEGVVVTTLLFHGPADPGSAVLISQNEVGRMQVEHLVQRGCRSIGYLGPLDTRLSGIAELRIAGARQACQELGVGELEIRRTDLSITDVLPVVDAWSAGGQSIDGVAAYNDEFGGAVLASLHQLGRGSPNDLAVIGVDNDPMSAFTSPPLSTVDQLAEIAGARLAAITAAALGMRDRPLPSVGPTASLVVRAST